MTDHTRIDGIIFDLKQSVEDLGEELKRLYLKIEAIEKKLNKENPKNI